MAGFPDNNAEMIAYWDGERGEAWAERSDQYDSQLEIYCLHVVSAAAPQPGETVLDIGCGAGATTFAASQAVGSAGKVVGVDISGPLLALATQRAQHDSYTHVQFVNADAQTMAPLDPPADVAISRFGVMFFDDPVAAFTNIARSVRADGRLSFACWAGVELNEWMLGPILAVADIIDLPAPPGPEAPGPFSFADQARVESILEQSGWENVTFEEITDSVYVGGPGTLDEAVDFVLSSSALADGLKEQIDAKREEARVRILDLFANQHDGVGVRYPAHARIVHAVKAD